MYISITKVITSMIELISERNNDDRDRKVGRNIANYNEYAELIAVSNCAGDRKHGAYNREEQVAKASATRAVRRRAQERRTTRLRLLVIALHDRVQPRRHLREPGCAPDRRYAWRGVDRGRTVVRRPSRRQIDGG